MSQSPYEPRPSGRRRLKPPGGPLSGRSGPYSLAQGERERDMSDEQECPMCGGPMVESHSPSGFLSRHWVDGDACRRRQRVQAVEREQVEKKRAEKAEADNKRLRGLLLSDCGAVYEWTATEQPDGSYVVSAGDTAISLVSASACGFCKRICLERQLAQAKEKAEADDERLAAREGQEGGKA